MRTFLLPLLLAGRIAAQPGPPQPLPGSPSGPGQVARPGAPVAAQPSAPAEGPAGWQGEFDGLWPRRDQPGVEAQLHRILDAQLAADKRSFEVNWRLASLYNWQADETEGDARANLAHKGWDAAEIAVAVRPGDVRSQYFCATGIGLYAEGVGILTALSQGLEGKFRSCIDTAIKIDKDYLDGAPQVVFGRYFFKLPWPKRNVDRSISTLAPLLETHPHNQRAKLYLADSLTDEGSIADAKNLVRQILEAPPGNDPPETHLMQTQARKWMASH